MSMKAFQLFVTLILCYLNSSCQANKELYPLSKEFFVKKNNHSGLQFSKFRLVGKNDNRLVYRQINEVRDDFFAYDEKANKLFPMQVNLNANSRPFRYVVLEKTVAFLGYYSLGKGLKDVPFNHIPMDNHEFQDLWIQHADRTVKLDSLPGYYLDKFYDVKFSLDGNWLICNPYTSNSAGYVGKEDGKFFLYDLRLIDRGEKVKKITVDCERCRNSIITDEGIFFQKEIPRKGGQDGYFNNIYKAPLQNLSDTTLVGFDIDLIAMSDDKKYCLGAKYLYGKYTPLILNLETGTYQYLLGRQYPVDNAFYSSVHGKFGFDYGSYIIYVEFPVSFPFKSTVNTSGFTTQEQDNAFWSRKQHDPMK